MNREQRRRMKRSDVCICCQLTDGTMSQEDFWAHCCGLASERGVGELDTIAAELSGHKRMPADLVAQCLAVVAQVRLVHSVEPMQQ